MPGKIEIPEEKLVPTPEGVETAILAFNEGKITWSSSELQKELPDTTGNEGKYLMVGSGPDSKPMWAGAATLQNVEYDEEGTALSGTLAQEGDSINVYSSEQVNKLLSWVYL